jgi:hypothetical protein
VIKKILLSFCVILFIIFAAVSSFVFYPHWYINQPLIEWGLEKSQVFESFTMETLSLDHKFESLSQRELSLEIQNFCFVRQQDELSIRGCLTQLNLDLQITIFPLFKFRFPQDVAIHFKSLDITREQPQESKEPEAPQATATVFDLEQIWNLSSHALIPGLKINVDSMVFQQDDLKIETAVNIRKTDENWIVVSDYFSLTKSQSFLDFQTPENFLVPYLKWNDQDVLIHLGHFRLEKEQKEFKLSLALDLEHSKLLFKTGFPSNIPLSPIELIRSLDSTQAQLTLNNLKDILSDEQLDSWSELRQLSVEVKMTSENTILLPRRVTNKINLKHPRGQLNFLIENDIHSLEIEDLLIHTLLTMEIHNFQKEVNTMIPVSFDWLPAPLNSLSGSGQLTLSFEESSQDNYIMIKQRTNLDFKGDQQRLELDFQARALLNLESYEISTLETELEFGGVVLILPFIDTRSLPPQFLPDSRIQRQTPPQVKKVARKEQAPPLSFDLVLETRADQPISLSSNLVDEPIRLGVQVDFLKSELQRALIQVLPLKTTIFRRPVELQELFVTIYPNEEPYFKGVVHFRLPQYLVTLDFEGPSNNVQTQLSSTPPLPLDDIYSVLLFGRPMMDLDDTSREDAGRGARMLSQGLLSLTTLYFFAGTPIQSLGYNPDRGQVEAQFGIGRRSSLRLSGGGSQGDRGLGVRRSLGRGWYIDTSVNQNTQQGSQTETIMLERIHAY